MTVRWETTVVDGSPMRVYLGVPERRGRLPGIVVAQPRGGVDTEMQDVVHRLFRHGYVVAAPELFHRQPADVDPVKRPGLMLDKEIIADVEATIALLKRAHDVVSPIGIVGFCLGGRVSYLAAAAIRGIAAAAIFYGGNIMIPRGNGPSPFERTAEISCPIIAFTGADDTNPSPEDMKKISAELARLDKPHEFHLYRGADHAFLNFSAGRYRERVARASWTEMLSFFGEHLKRAGGK